MIMFMMKPRQIQLIPCGRVLLDTLIVVELVKEFLAFYGTRRYITVFIRARHWSLSITT